MYRTALASFAATALVLSACAPQQTAQPTSALGRRRQADPRTQTSRRRPDYCAGRKPTDRHGRCCHDRTSARRGAATTAPAAKPKVELQDPPAGKPLAPAVPLNALTGTVQIDGSSTVFPVTEAMAEEFQKASGGKVRATVGISGTGGGFQVLQQRNRHLGRLTANSLAEMERCKAAGITWMDCRSPSTACRS